MGRIYKTVAIALSAWLLNTAQVSAFWQSVGFDQWGGSSSQLPADQERYALTLTSLVRQLADQIKSNHRESRGEASTVVVASIVNLENPSEANRIGLALSSSLMHALQVRGYRTIDFHLKKVMQVTHGGDFVTSNKIEELRGNFDITYMVTGTLSEHRDGVVVTLKMVDWETGVVVSSAEAHITTEQYFGLMSDMEIERPVVQVMRKKVPEPIQRTVKLRRHIREK